MRRRPALRAPSDHARLALALATAAAVLDIVCRHDAAIVRADFGTTAVFLIVTSIVSFFSSFGGSGSKAILRAFNDLRGKVVDLGKAIGSGLFQAALSIGLSLRPQGNLWSNVLKPGLGWLFSRLESILGWMKNKLGPVLRFLKRLNDELQKIYDRFVRPVVEVINLIRMVHRALQVFHINVLGKLDEVLGKVEDRLEEPFLWLRQKITWLENWIDRIVTADGLLQRLTLIRTTWKHIGDVSRQWWNGSIREISASRKQRMLVPPAELTPKEYSEAFREATLEGRGDLAPAISEFVDGLRIVAHQT